MKPKKAAGPTPKLTGAQQHARFMETARQVEASEDPKDFDKAFQTVATSAKK